MGLLYCVGYVDCHLLHDIWAIDSLKSLLVMPCLLSWWCVDDLRRNWAQWGKSSDGIHFKSSWFKVVGRMLLPAHVSCCCYLSISSHTSGSLKSREFISIKLSSIVEIYSIFFHSFPACSHVKFFPLLFWVVLLQTRFNCAATQAQASSDL